MYPKHTTFAMIIHHASSAGCSNGGFSDGQRLSWTAVDVLRRVGRLRTAQHPKLPGTRMSRPLSFTSVTTVFRAPTLCAELTSPHSGPVSFGTCVGQNEMTRIRLYCSTLTIDYWLYHTHFFGVIIIVTINATAIVVVTIISRISTIDMQSLCTYVKSILLTDLH